MAGFVLQGHIFLWVTWGWVRSLLKRVNDPQQIKNQILLLTQSASVETRTCTLGRNTSMSPSSPLRCRSRIMWQEAAARSRPAGGSRYSISAVLFSEGTLRWGALSPRKLAKLCATAGSVSSTTLSSERWRHTSRSSPSSASVATVRSWASSMTRTPYCRSRGSDIISSSRRASVTNLQRADVTPALKRRRAPAESEASYLSMVSGVQPSSWGTL